MKITVLLFYLNVGFCLSASVSQCGIVGDIDGKNLCEETTTVGNIVGETTIDEFAFLAELEFEDVTIDYYSSLKDCKTFNGTLGKWIELGSCPVLYNLSIQSPLPPESSYLLKTKCDDDGDTKVCCDENNIEQDIFKLLSDTYTGLCNDNDPRAVFGGRAANIGEFPWMAVLEYTTKHGRQFNCGGSLINNRYILTAAHCIKDSLISVRLGEHDISKPNDCGFCEDSIDVGIAEKIPHEGYVGYTRQNDIGLLRLAKEVNFTGFIKPILLPKSPKFTNKAYQGSTMTVAGWGLTENGTSSDILRKLNVVVGYVGECKMLYAGKTKISSALICAGGEGGKDSCNGDSGGPLMLEEDDNIYAIGIISFGSSQCGLQNWPAVHTKVSYYMEWIDNKLQP